ncbi:hypothetical protein QL285_003554 [Trifolium repens]|nr:hypothetical protein QL285_003554 [Trifolium repens]
MINPSSKAYGLFSRVSLSSNEICYCPLDKDQSSDTCDDFTTTRKYDICDCQNCTFRRSKPLQCDICDSSTTVDDFYVATALCDSFENRRDNCRYRFCNGYKPSLYAIFRAQY